ASEKDPVTSKNFELLGEIDYSADGWLFGTSGIHAVPLTESQLKSAQTAPLALAAEQPSGTNLFAIRESADGLFSCPEEFVQRIDSPDKSSVVVHTAQYGKALPAANVQLSLLPPQSGVGIGNPNAPNQPKAPVPVIGTEPQLLSFLASVPSDNTGRATVDITVSALDNPRGYLDGQIYLISYGIAGESPHAQFDFIVVHGRN